MAHFQHPEESFDLKFVQGIEKIIFKLKFGHPDNIPYVVVWWDLLEDLHSWLKPFIPKQQAEVLALETQKSKDIKEEILDHPSPSVPCLYLILQGGSE